MARASVKIPEEHVRLGRRELVLGAGAALLGGCSDVRAGSPRTAGGSGVTKPPPATVVPSRASRRARRLGLRESVDVSVHSFFDLPQADPRSHELSGIAWDDATGTLLAVQDERAQVVTLTPDDALRTWAITGALPLEVGDQNDLEGLVLLPDGFIVCTEIGPHLFELDRSGRLRREIPLPAYFATARRNKSLESLSLSPSGRYLFTTTEAALGCDGVLATISAGTSVRIVRIDLATNDLVEHVYMTDPIAHADSDQGVSELLALSDEELLVLERGFTKGIGNTARIYRTKLEGGAVCTNLPHVHDVASRLPKRLFVDLGALGTRELPPVKQPQPSPLLDNFEGLAMGPDLPDGRGSLLLVSDDNGRATQVARVLVLALG